MSIHRPKRASFRTNRESSTSLEPKEDPRPASWTEAVEGKNDTDFRAYSVRESYVMGDGVSHPKFGPGVVVEVEPNKMAVLFESGERRLVHSMN
ncbi:MAG: hypothetical protein ACOC1F_01045 [Myxococcota bacterium]